VKGGKLVSSVKFFEKYKVKKVLALEIAEKEKANWITGNRMGVRRRSINSWNFLQMVRLFPGFWDKMKR
jgi:hypothetical protein